MTATNADIQRVHTLAATIEAGGIINKQWAFGTDTKQIIVRNGGVYNHMAGIEALNIFEVDQTIKIASGNGSLFLETESLDSDFDLSLKNDSQEWLMSVKGSDSDKWILRNETSVSNAIEIGTDNVAHYLSGIELEANADFTLSSLSDIIGNAFSVAGATGAVTAFSLDVGTTIVIVGTLDDDTFATASNTTWATSESIKAFVNTSIGGFLRQDGTTPLTGNWGVGGFNLDNVGSITLAANADYLGSNTTDINIGGNFTVAGATGNGTFLGALGVGSVLTDGTLHVQSGSAGSVSASSVANIGVFESNTSDGISVLVPDSANAKYVLGSVSDNDAFFINWNFNANLVGLTVKPAGSEMAFSTANAEAMRINSAGKVGIGTDSPNDNLEIFGTNPALGIHSDSITGTSEIFFRDAAGAAGRLRYDHADNSLLIFANGSSATFTNTSLTLASNVDFIGSNTSQMIFDTDGFVWDAGNRRLGIGTAVPSTIIDAVESNIASYAPASNASTITLRNTQSTVNDAVVGISMTVSRVSGSNGVVNLLAVPSGSGSGDFIVQSRNSGTFQENLRVTADGKLGIGTSSPDSILEVAALVTPTISITNTDFSVISNQELGSLDFISSDGNSGSEGIVASIKAVATTNYAGLRPAKIEFYTTKSTSNILAIDIDEDQILNVYSGINLLANADYLGSPTTQINLDNKFVASGATGDGFFAGTLDANGLVSAGAGINLIGKLNMAQKAGTAVDGDFWNDSTQKTLQTFVGGIEQSLVGCIFTQTEDETIANIDTENTLFGGGVGTFSLPANFWVVGKSIRIIMYGCIEDTGTPSAEIQAYYGATSIIDSGAVTLTALSAKETWKCILLITCRSTGVSGSVQTIVNFEYETTTGSSPIRRLDVSGVVTTINTTVSGDLNVTFQWGAADVANIITNEMTMIEVLN